MWYWGWDSGADVTGWRRTLIRAVPCLPVAPVMRMLRREGEELGSGDLLSAIMGSMLADTGAVRELEEQSYGRL